MTQMDGMVIYIPDEGQWGSVDLNYFWIAPHSMVNTATVAEDSEIMISESTTTKLKT